MENSLGRDVLLLFSARALDDPDINFDSILNDSHDRPYTAIGVRGLSTDRIIHSVGSYRVKITLTGDDERDSQSNKVTETLINTASTLLGIAWDSERKTKMLIRRLEALTVYGSTPREGVIELEIESSDAAPLDMAMSAVKATVVKTGETANIKTETELLSYIPPGKPENSAKLLELLRKLSKEQRLKIKEENGADPAAFFTAQDIPAISMGIALGREGREKDIINIDSVERGRTILERLVIETGKNHDISDQ